MAKTVHMVDPELKREMCEAIGLERISDKTASILDLNSKGIALETAHKLVTGKERLPVSTKSELKSKADKWLLKSPTMQRLAHKAVKETLQMKPIETEKGPIYPKVSDRLAAASMVADRIEPIRQEHGAGINKANIQINIQELFIDTKPQHVVHEKPIGIVSEPESK